MPNYDYLCPIKDCRKHVIEARRMDQRYEAPLCPVCGERMTFAMLQAPGSTWKTHGQHRDEYSKTGPREK